jgi:hypothetical protein
VCVRVDAFSLWSLAGPRMAGLGVGGLTDSDLAAKAEAKKLSAHVYQSSHHVDAARSGQAAVEIDLFREFDADGSGTLSKRELRRLCVGVKKHLGPSMMLAMQLDELTQVLPLSNVNRARENLPRPSANPLRAPTRWLSRATPRRSWTGTETARSSSPSGRRTYRRRCATPCARPVRSAHSCAGRAALGRRADNSSRTEGPGQLPGGPTKQ